MFVAPDVNSTGGVGEPRQTWFRAFLSVDDLDPERGREQSGAADNVVPRHARATQRLRAADAGEVTAAQLDRLDGYAREGCLAQLAALEEHVLQRRSVEVALAHPTVAEDDALETRVAKPNQVDATLVECDVAECCLCQLGPGQAAAAKLDSKHRQTMCTAIRPVLVGDNGVGEIAELVNRRRIVGSIRWVRRTRRLRHLARICEAVRDRGDGARRDPVQRSGSARNGLLQRLPHLRADEPDRDRARFTRGVAAPIKRRIAADRAD